jgi:hypothetical protein
MKSLRSLIRQSALILMAALLLVFSVLTYAGGDALLLERDEPVQYTQAQIAIVEEVADAQQPLAAAFQQDRGLPASGDVDCATWGALLKG